MHKSLELAPVPVPDSLNRLQGLRLQYANRNAIVVDKTMEEMMQTGRESLDRAEYFQAFVLMKAVLDEYPQHADLAFDVQLAADRLSPVQWQKIRSMNLRKEAHALLEKLSASSSPSTSNVTSP